MALCLWLVAYTLRSLACQATLLMWASWMLFVKILAQNPLLYCHSYLRESKLVKVIWSEAS